MLQIVFAEVNNIRCNNDGVGKTSFFVLTRATVRLAVLTTKFFSFSQIYFYLISMASSGQMNASYI